MSSFGTVLAALLATKLVAALPQDDLPTQIVPTGTSAFGFVSTWATETSGTDSITYTPYLEQQTNPISSSASNSSSSSGSGSSVSHVVVPIVVVILVVLAAVGIFMFFQLRRKRALRAHRRKTSWIASNKYRWQPNATKAQEADGEADAPPLPSYDNIPTVRIPHQASTHERKTSIL